MYQHELKAAEPLRRVSPFARRRTDSVASGTNWEAAAAMPFAGSRPATIPRRFLDQVQGCRDELKRVDLTRPYSRSLALDHVADYVQLMRPRLALLVLATAAVGWLLAAGDAPNWNGLGGSLLAIAVLF